AAASAVRAGSPRLVNAILAAVAGSPSASVTMLLQGVTVNGIVAHLKIASLALVAPGMPGLGLASVASISAQPDPAQVMEKKAKEGEKAAAQKDQQKPDERQRTITGRVVNTEGKPVVADLYLLWLAGSPEVLGKVAADGTFQVTVPLKE